NPRPSPDPHLPLFLHGEPDSSGDVSIVWRADLPEQLDERAITVIECLPPRSGEALAVPVWAARKWLVGSISKAVDQLSDIESQSPAEHPVEGSDRTMRRRYALRWRGALDDETKLVEAPETRPGDTLIVPSSYGGCDSFGWLPEGVEAVVDIADAAAEPYMSRHAALRLHPALWSSLSDHISWTACLDGAPSSRVWLRLCERFGCGHVFGLLARETNVPLALMLVRMALRPISKTRSLWRLPFSSGFRADPLVPIASPSPSMRIALRRNLVP